MAKALFILTHLKWQICYTFTLTLIFYFLLSLHCTVLTIWVRFRSDEITCVAFETFETYYKHVNKFVFQCTHV